NLGNILKISETDFQNLQLCNRLRWKPRKTHLLLICKSKMFVPTDLDLAWMDFERIIILDVVGGVSPRRCELLRNRHPHSFCENMGFPNEKTRLGFKIEKQTRRQHVRHTVDIIVGGRPCSR